MRCHPACHRESNVSRRVVTVDDELRDLLRDSQNFNLYSSLRSKWWIIRDHPWCDSSPLSRLERCPVFWRRTIPASATLLKRTKNTNAIERTTHELCNIPMQVKTTSHHWAVNTQQQSSRTQWSSNLQAFSSLFAAVTMLPLLWCTIIIILRVVLPLPQWAVFTTSLSQKMIIMMMVIHLFSSRSIRLSSQTKMHRRHLLHNLHHAAPSCINWIASSQFYKTPRLISNHTRSYQETLLQFQKNMFKFLSR